MARRTAEEAARTREALLLAGRHLFTEQGFSGTTAEEIADRAGVTRGALYHHFGGKRGLFSAVFEQLEQELDRQARSAARAAVEEGDGPIEIFLAGCRAFLEQARRPDYRQIALVDGVAVLGEASWHETDSRLGLATVEGGLRRLQETGQLRALPLRALAVLVIGALNEAGFALARGEPDLDDDAILAALRAILDGLRA